MASKTDIANRALTKLGEGRVSNIETDGSISAVTINGMWTGLRDYLQKSFPWHFCIKRYGLAASATAPAWGYSTAYPFPTDYLALLEIQNDPDYILEGGHILTNVSGQLNIRYIARIEDVSQFDPMFNEAFSCLLAHEACERITQSNTKKESLRRDMMKVINDAYTEGSILDLPQKLALDEWISSREESSMVIDYGQVV